MPCVVVADRQTQAGEQLAVPYADAMLVALPDGIEPVAAASVADNVCDAHRHVAPHCRSCCAGTPMRRC